MGRKRVFHSSWDSSYSKDQIFTKTGLDAGAKIPWASMLQGKDTKNLGRNFSLNAHVVASSEGARREKRWKEGKMEIARSRLSQGPRGCSAGKEEQGPEKFSPRDS